MKSQKGFDSVVINGFRQGSVIVDSTIKFKTPVETKSIENVIKQAAVDNPNPNFNINKDKIGVSELTITTQTTTSTQPPTTTTKMIYLMSLKLTLDQTFTIALNDKASSNYTTLKTEIETFSLRLIRNYWKSYSIWFNKIVFYIEIYSL